MLIKNIPRLFILSIFLLTSCNTNPSASPPNREFFTGRDDGQSQDRPLLYRALVPSHWIRQDTSPSESTVDTTKSICEFYIHENDQSIRLTIHTFPIIPGQMRIPPRAQIARWKRQFEELNLLATQVNPDSYSGFSGLFFEGEGILNGKPTKMMGWSMQLASVYERQLSQARKPLDRCKCADYTIKASGSPEMMNKHRTALLAFARSFELIDELPFSP